MPRAIYFHDTKPEFYLDNGDVLHGYGVDLVTGKVLGSHYCGSGCSTIHHRAEQLSSGAQAPNGRALMFVHEYWNGKNMSWTVTVVSPNIQREIGGCD